jgi:hypothetical protein
MRVSKCQRINKSSGYFKERKTTLFQVELEA